MDDNSLRNTKGIHGERAILSKYSPNLVLKKHSI
jgi:hypothetical protein